MVRCHRVLWLRRDVRLQSSFDLHPLVHSHQFDGPNISVVFNSEGMELVNALPEPEPIVIDIFLA